MFAAACFGLNQSCCEEIFLKITLVLQLCPWRKDFTSLSLTSWYSPLSPELLISGCESSIAASLQVIVQFYVDESAPSFVSVTTWAGWWSSLYAHTRCTAARRTCLPVLPLALCCYVMTEAIASRKHSYTLYTYLRVKFWQVEMWELAGDAGTHVLTHLCGRKTRCISFTNHLSPFMMSDSLFSQTTLTDTNMFNSVDFAPLCFHKQDRSYSTNLFSPSITTWFKLLGLTARLQPPSFSSSPVGLSAGHEFSNIGGFPQGL